MKWMKRLVGLVVVLVLVLGLAALGMYYYGVRGTPEWWKRPTISAEEQAAAANRADQKIMQTLSVVAEMDAASRAETQPADPSDHRPVATQSAKPIEVTFTEGELNGFFNKWDRLYGLTETYKAHITNPGVVIHDERLVLAGDSPKFGSVLSLHFAADLDDKGRLKLQLAKALAGRMPAGWAMDSYRAAVRDKLVSVLPNLQREAELRPDGSANSEMVLAAMAKLFLHVLKDEPGEPVLFLPMAGKDGSLPVKLTDVEIEGKNLTLTVMPLNKAERAALVERVREPYDEKKKPEAVSAGSSSETLDRGS